MLLRVAGANPANIERTAKSIIAAHNFIAALSCLFSCPIWDPRHVLVTYQQPFIIYLINSLWCASSSFLPIISCPGSWACLKSWASASPHGAPPSRSRTWRQCYRSHAATWRPTRRPSPAAAPPWYVHLTALSRTWRQCYRSHAATWRPTRRPSPAAAPQATRTLAAPRSDGLVHLPPPPRRPPP